MLDLARLFGGVDVDGAVRRHRRDSSNLIRRGGAQRVRRNADHRAVEPGDGGPATLKQAGEAVDRVQEAGLARAGWGIAEIAVGIEDGQQREADPGRAEGSRTMTLLESSATLAYGLPSGW